MVKEYNWQLVCVTEDPQEVKYVWSVEAPTGCPDSGSHVVLSGSVFPTEFRVISDTLQCHNSSSHSITDTVSTLLFDTVDTNSNSNVLSLSSGEITVGRDGLFDIHFHVTSEVVQGSKRTTTEYYLERYTSSSWAKVSGTDCRTTQQTTSNSGSIASHFNGNLVSGDKLRVRCQTIGSGNANIEAMQEKCSFSIRSVDDQ